MAARTRINTKFLFILLMTVLAGGILVGGLVYLQIRGDATRHMRRGHEALAQGDPETAARHFARAVGREPANLEYLRTYEDTIRSIRPETADSARTYYGRLLAAMNQEVNHNSFDAESHLRLLEELHTGARILSVLASSAAQQQHWTQISDAASYMLQSVPESEPKHPYGCLYRGMATLRLRAVVTESDLHRAVEDLDKFLEAYPDHDLGWATLAHGRRMIAEHMQGTTSTRQAAEAMAAVEPTMQQAIAAVPDGPFTNLAYAQYLFWQLGQQAEGVTSDKARAAARRAVNLVRQADDPWLLLEASQIAMALDDEPGEALSMFVDYIERDPAALAHRYFLAQLYYRRGETDNAADLAEQIIESEPLPVSFIAQMQLTLRRLAASLMVDIEHRRFAQADADGREPDIDRVRHARERLLSFVADPDNDPQLIRADAKLALLEEDYDAAAAGFERLIRQGSGDIETHVLSAFALEHIGQVGLAHERTTAALVMPGASSALLFRKARLEFQMGRYDEAAESIAVYTAQAPDDQQGAALSRAVNAALAGEEISIDDPVALALSDAQQAMAEGQVDTARSTIEAAMAQIEGEDLRLLNAATRIAMGAGQMELAQGYVDRALAVAPDSRHFRQLQALLVAGDPITAAEQYTESEYEDPAERAVMLLLTYAAVQRDQTANAARLEERGEQEAASAARNHAQRAEQAAAAQLEKAIAVAPNHPLLIEYRFTRALGDRNWTDAETLANRARDLDADRSRGLLYRGRYEFHRGRFENAVRAFEQAAEIIPHSTVAWRGLAMSYQQLGNMAEAQRAYEQAYRANPTDMSTVRTYLTLLGQIGEQARALRIAQTAHRLVPNDTQMREVWLELESQMDNLADVLRTRRRILQENPTDRDNALRLALLLTRSEPTVETILDDNGDRQFTDRRWAQMAALEQRRIIDETRASWRDEADAILASIEEREGQDLTLVSTKALVHRTRGDIAGGEQVLRSFVEQQGDSPQVMAVIALAQYLSEVGQYNEAWQELTRALEYQSDAREADLALGHFLFERKAFDRAIQHYERVQEAAPDHSVQMRIVESYVNQGKFAEADQRLHEAFANQPLDFSGAMLRAMIAHGMGVQLAMAERSTEAEARFNEHREALETAERLMPTSPVPHVMRARALLADFNRTKDSSLLNAALTSLGRADAVKANDPQTSLVRIEVLRASNNHSGAVAEATRLVNRSPDNLQYRTLLVQLHMAAGNHAGAVAAIREAIERQPTMVMWHEMLGNVHAEAGNMKEASAAYRRAYEIDQSVQTLLRYVGALFSDENPDYASVLQTLGAVPELVADQPVLGASAAVALYKTGRLEAANQYMRQSFEKQQELVRDGSVAAGEIGRWFQVMAIVFNDLHPQEVQGQIMELCQQKPGPYELLWMSRFWRSRGPEGMSRSTELLTQAIDQADPTELQLRVALQFELAGVYLVSGQYEQAATGYQRVLRMDANHRPSLNNLAFIMAEHLGDPSGAVPYAQQALDLSPLDPFVLDTLGWIHFKLGNYSQAEEYLRRSLRAQEMPATLLHMAHVLHATGDYDAALARLVRASEMRPDAETQAEINRLVDDIRTKRSEAR